MRVLEVGFGSSGVNIAQGYYPKGVAVVGLDPLLATYPLLPPTTVVTDTTPTTTITAAQRIYQQQADDALNNHGVHLERLVQGVAEALPFPDASFDAVGRWSN